LSSFQSIRNFASKVIETEPRIDILIHNAGYCGAFKKVMSDEGIEMTLAVNCYGPFLLTHLLIDLMKKSAPSKIVVVSSKAHSTAYFNPRKAFYLNPINFWPPLLLYATSKFITFLFTYELARRLKDSGVTVNILHPGTCDSPIWERAPFPFSIYISFSRLFMKTVEQGIQTILYVSLSKNLESVNGKYFRDCKMKKSSNRTYNRDMQNVMWEESRKIVQITENDPFI
jgi:NAD(P)-dependent dehydrogenase (short-subunit alcohol dehydrogenase family)